ncbi:hypothetical protein DFH07DRAFT_945636 [Mycena maculata]|uniref:Uncharacterized protein n=1 Tax=Mycena maculata TaxID=230809 RepID=A0AAD7HVN0_9AGAR|nr:hypothetical protein DFH07DRAFT_945636 [Mycena maculata]
MSLCLSLMITWCFSIRRTQVCSSYYPSADSSSQYFDGSTSTQRLRQRERRLVARAAGKLSGLNADMCSDVCCFKEAHFSTFERRSPQIIFTGNESLEIIEYPGGCHPLPWRQQPFFFFLKPRRDGTGDGMAVGRPSRPSQRVGWEFNL